jgi:hypothetical protein
MVSCSECANEPMGSIKCGEYLSCFVFAKLRVRNSERGSCISFQIFLCVFEFLHSNAGRVHKSASRLLRFTYFII